MARLSDRMVAAYRWHLSLGTWDSLIGARYEDVSWYGDSFAGGGAGTGAGGAADGGEFPKPRCVDPPAGEQESDFGRGVVSATATAGDAVAADRAEARAGAAG